MVTYLGELGKRIFPSHPHALENSLREIAKYAALAAFSKLGMQPYLDLQKSFAEDLSKALLNLVKYGPCGDELDPELREHNKLFSGKTVRIWKQLRVSMDIASAQFAQTDGGLFSVSEVYERKELDVADFLPKKRVRSDPGRAERLGKHSRGRSRSLSPGRRKDEHRHRDEGRRGRERDRREDYWGDRGHRARHSHSRSPPRWRSLSRSRSRSHSRGREEGFMHLQTEEDTIQEEDGVYLKSEESLCWKHLTERGCNKVDCKFIHMDRKGMGWRPSTQQEDLLKRRIRNYRGACPKWNWSKIRSFELNQSIFN